MSDLVENFEDWFSHISAQLLMLAGIGLQLWLVGLITFF